MGVTTSSIPFRDCRASRESSLAGETGIPPGYWVYVYPRWYVFREKP